MGGFDSSTRVAPENFSANMEIVEIVRDMAERKENTPACSILAWLLAKKPWIVPVPGTKSVSCLEENLGAVNVFFDADEPEAFNKRLDEIEIVGDRCPVEVDRLVDRQQR